MRARWAILKTGYVVSIREVELKNKPKELIEISPKGTVPVLKTKNGTIIDESLDIIKWTFRKSDPLNILRVGCREEQLKINELIKQNDNVFKIHLDRFKYPNRYPNSKPEKHWKEARSILCFWNSKLKVNNKNTNNWLVGDSESIADWAIWPFVRQFWLADKERLERDHELKPLITWLNYFLEDPLFSDLMKKEKKWSPNDNPINFPRNANYLNDVNYIYHLAIPEEWERAKNNGVYERSTRGLRLSEVGFIHASFLIDIEDTYKRFFKDISKIFILKIKVELLDCPVRVEGDEEGKLYPHIYGYITTRAVKEVFLYP